MDNAEIVTKCISLCGKGPTHWIAQECGITDQMVDLILKAYSRGFNAR